jgi:hypothetical protein
MKKGFRENYSNKHTVRKHINFYKKGNFLTSFNYYNMVGSKRRNNERLIGVSSIVIFVSEVLCGLIVRAGICACKAI